MNNVTTLINHGNLFSYLRSSNPFSRSIALIISVTMLNLYISPAIAAVQNNADAQKKRAKIEEAKLGATPEERFSSTLHELQATAHLKKLRIDKRITEEGGLLDEVLTFFGLSQLTLEEKSDLQGLEKRINRYHGEMLKSLQDQTAMLEAKKLPEKILARQRAKLDDYMKHYNELQSKLDAFYSAEDLTQQSLEANELHDFMQQQQIKQSNQPFDPNHLPWGSPDPKQTPKPAKSVDELLSDSGVSPYAQGIEVAALNSIPPLDQAGGPTASDLGENIEVQITDEIRAKAEELNHDPVTIYNWVRNNTEWLPTFGSIQGSQYTLDTMKGNAFDISSLLIALLRASNIPARYGYGVVDIPAEKANNWVGGTKNADATQSLLGQGGIPNEALVLGGQTRTIRMNHIWVEAWVDYHPSRGSKHKIGDSWIPLDASFKQYEYKEGKNLQTEVPFDAEGFAQQLIDSATIDEAAGTVQGIDQTLIESQLTTYQAQIQTYIDNLDPTTTVGDVLGEHKVIQQEFRELYAGLPYQVNLRTNNFHTLTDNLRYYYNLVVKKGGSSGALGALSTPYEVMRGRYPLAQVANNFLALSFEPETEDDEAALLALIPEPAEGEELQLEELPTGLPGGVIGMKAQITVDGEVDKEVGNWLLGEEFTFSQNFEKPLHQYTHPQDTIGVVGAYYAIGLGVGVQNFNKSERLKSSLNESKIGIDQLNIDPTMNPASSLSKHHIVGAVLQAGVFAWFSKSSVDAAEIADNQNIIYYDLPSFGTFSTSFVPTFSFGIVPTGASFEGLSMDIQGSHYMRVHAANNQSMGIAYSKIRGMNASSNEHIVPEQLFSTQQEPVKAISAVKFIQESAKAGQKIFTITKSNIDQLSNVTAGDRDEMLLAINNGKEVVVHESPVQGYGKINAGYMIIDPETGAGAYLISGGSNGGKVEWKNTKARLFQMKGFLKKAAGPLVSALYQLYDILDILENCKPSLSRGSVIGLALVSAFMVGVLLGASASLATTGVGAVIGVVMTESMLRTWKYFVKKTCQ